MINITNEDNMDLMARYPDNYFDLAIVDPPYGIDVAKMAYTQEDNRPVKQKNGGILRVKKLKYKHGDWDKFPPKKEYFDELFRVSKHQIIWGIKHFNISGIGNGIIKWNKGVPDGVSFNKYEYAYCSFINYVKVIDYLWAGMMQGKSIKYPMIQKGNKQLNEKRQHPTQKPVILYDLIFLFCIECGIDISVILDTHIGLLSIVISSLKFKVEEFVGCELDKEYYEAAIKRLKEHQSQLKINYVT